MHSATILRGVKDELRLVTVLFADIVGSSRLGERLPPDEVKALVGECVTMMSRAVEEYGGIVQAYQGDGICAYFGVPITHEDEPERAARAALRILEVVREYGAEVEAAWSIEKFSVRVGINTGQAAVGTVGAADPGVVALGDVTNVAARLQGLADPGTILVGGVTARLLAHRFVFESRGNLALKGRSEPVAAARLVGAKPPEPVEAGTLVGRDDELERLRTVLADVVAGRGRVVLLVGEAGIGKTRLLAELRSLFGESVTWLDGRCLSYGGLAAWPFAETLLGWLGADIGEPEIALRTKLRARLGPLVGADRDELLPSLGRLLRLGLEGGGSPQDAYVRWLEALAAERPVIVALEDAHWADDATLELADAVLASTDRAPIGLLVTQEPGASFRLRALGEYGHRTAEVTLGPLSDEAAATLLGDSVDAPSRIRLVREGEGNPLYLEELARALRDGALESRGRTWTVTVRDAELLPPALENLLVARIDRLPEDARRVAQIGAAIGRTFPVAVVEGVAGEGISTALAALLRAEIVRETRRYPELECTFAHGLLHDAALSTLTPAHRRDLYASIASAFEALYESSLDDHLERLGHYHAQAGNLTRALEYVERARSG